MTGLAKHGLTARFVGIMLLALAISQGISFLLFMDERGQALVLAAKTEFLSRSASVAQLIEATPAPLHADVLRASDTGYSRFWMTPGFPADTETWREQARARLAAPLPAVASLTGSPPAEPDTQATAPARTAAVPAVASVLPSAPGTAAPARWNDLPAHAWPLSRPAKFIYLGFDNGMGLAVQLRDGSWLSSAAIKKMPTLWSTQSIISLAVTAVIVSIGATLIARGMTLPMRRLAHAAEALGRGESLEPLPESGPEDIRQTAVAFNLMRARLQRFVEDRTRMLAAIGHDLRTPITSMRLRVEFVADEEVRERLLDTLDELRALTEATLAFSREQAAGEPTRNVDVAALVESLCDDLVELGHDVSYRDGARAGYRCRPDALKRAVRNLVENAVRYGGRARVTCTSGPAGLAIVIEDDGPGIPQEAMERVFDPFVRMEDSRSRETGGIGLGLSIARDVVRHHGGDIQLANTGHGLRATILLPPVGPVATPAAPRKRLGRVIGRTRIGRGSPAA